MKIHFHGTHYTILTLFCQLPVIASEFYTQSNLFRIYYLFFLQKTLTKRKKLRIIKMQHSNFI